MLPLQLNNERFAEALQAARARVPEGIGTQKEKLLHATLKNYFAGEEDEQEVPVLGYVADVFGKDGIVEIQTGSFSKIKEKLSVLTDHYPVTLVCPLMRKKTVYWLDPRDGSVSGGRGSPKKGAPCHLLWELLPLCTLAGKEGFRVVIFYYDGEEYRLADGWSKDGKKGSHRVERVPCTPVDLYELCTIEDYHLLLPEKCPAVFTSKEFAKFSGLKGRKCSAALKMLLELGIVTRVLDGRQYLYSVCDTSYLK